MLGRGKPPGASADGLHGRDDQRREAVEHEVHRMAYRINLEIQDQLITQFQDDGHMDRLARTMGLSQDVIESLEELGQDMAAVAFESRQLESPTGDDITDNANLCLIHYAIENTAQDRDETAVRELMQPTTNRRETAERAQLAMNYIVPTLVNEIQAAVENAARWNDDEILDGAQDLHFEFTQLGILQTNAAKAAWLLNRSDRILRNEMASDCVARALNEATGGEQYGPIWEDLTESIQALDPNRDVYEKFGMQMVFDASQVSDHLMRKL